MTSVTDLQNVSKSSHNIKNNQMCRKCQKDISYEKQKTVKSSGQIPLATYMYVQNTCIMNTDNLENETKDNSTDSTDENNNLKGNFTIFYMLAKYVPGDIKYIFTKFY
jgi:hypothetical protein